MICSTRGKEWDFQFVIGAPFFFVLGLIFIVDLLLLPLEWVMFTV